nr:uncharacterized protein LOC127328410 [Lolium perenne]
MDQQDGHVVDIELGCAVSGEPTRCCAVCTEPLAWVAVDSCGHGVVCPRCMVRVRFVEGDRCCSACGANSPSVIVAKADDSTSGGAPAVPALSQQPASKEGKVGEYWYQGDTAAYFHDEQQDEEARDAKTRREDLVDNLFTCAVLAGAGVLAIVVMHP